MKLSYCFKATYCFDCVCIKRKSGLYIGSISWIYRINGLNVLSKKKKKSYIYCYPILFCFSGYNLKKNVNLRKLDIKLFPI